MIAISVLAETSARIAGMYRGQKSMGFSAPIHCQPQQLQGVNIVESREINVLIVGGDRWDSVGDECGLLVLRRVTRLCLCDDTSGHGDGMELQILWRHEEQGLGDYALIFSPHWQKTPIGGTGNPNRTFPSPSELFLFQIKSGGR